MGYIKGITIEIDGETKGLDAALKKINSSTRNINPKELVGIWPFIL